MNATAESKKPLSFWLFAGIDGLLCILLLLFIAMLFADGKTSHDHLMQNAQRLMLIAADKSIKGEMRSTAPETTQEVEPDVEVPSAAANLVGFDVGGEEEEAADTAAPVLSAPSTASLVGSEDETLDAIPLEPRTNASLAALNQKLVEKTTVGLLPRKGGGTSSFEAYKRPIADAAKRRPLIALIVTGLGAVKQQTEEAIALPLDVTLAFNPYAKHAPVWLESARNKGHEAWLMLPAQPDDFPASDPGPDALLIDLKPEEELIPRLYNVLQKTHGYAGVLLPTSEVASDSLDLMKWLNKELDGRGLGLIAADMPTNSASVGFFKREDMTYPADIILDETLNEASIAAQLSSLEGIARSQGYAIGILRPYPISMRMVNDWFGGLAQKGFALAPASAVIEKK